MEASAHLVSHAALTERRAQQARWWRRIQRVHSLIVESQEFRQGTGKSAEAVHWKLDPAENHSRMRLKLKRNKNFSDHAAALVKSRSKAEAAAEEAKISSVISEIGHFRRASLDAPLIAPSDEPLLPALLSSGRLRRVQVHAAEEGASEVLFASGCALVTPSRTTSGQLEINASVIAFKEKRGPEETAASLQPRTLSSRLDAVRPLKKRSWLLSQLREIHLRRFLLKNCALELFLLDQTVHFLRFDSTEERDRCHRALLRLRPPALLYADARSPEEILRHSGLTAKWQRGAISNFDYLMQLNTLAGSLPIPMSPSHSSGRTYNDITQYPVFPWVLADYSSAVLDLTDPKSYRDLSKPVGALNPDRLRDLQKRYRSWPDPDTPAFLYGSHYSSAYTVAHYLIRMVRPLSCPSTSQPPGTLHHPVHCTSGRQV